MNKKNAGRKKKLVVLDDDRKEIKEQAESFRSKQSGLSDIQMSPPKHLDNIAKNLWRDLVPEMRKLGTLKKVDKVMLEALCTTYSVYRKSEEEIEKNGLFLMNNDGVAERRNPAVMTISECSRNIKSLCADLGLTFNSRAVQLDTKVPDGADQHDEKPAFKKVRF